MKTQKVGGCEGKPVVLYFANYFVFNPHAIEGAEAPLQAGRRIQEPVGKQKVKNKDSLKKSPSNPKETPNQHNFKPTVNEPLTDPKTNLDKNLH